MACSPGTGVGWGTHAPPDRTSEALMRYPIRSIGQLTVGMPVWLYTRDRPDHPMGMVVARVYDDPSLGTYRTTAVLHIRPGGWAVTVRQDSLQGTDAARNNTFAHDVRTAECWRCPRPPHATTVAEVLSPQGMPSCRAHSGVRPPAAEWHPAAVAEAYAEDGR